MSEIMRQLLKFKRCQKGANAIEYAMIAVLVALGVIVAVGAAGESISNLFGTSSSGITGVLSDSSSQI